MVGMTGLEPATSRPPAVRASQTAPHPAKTQKPWRLMRIYSRLHVQVGARRPPPQRQSYKAPYRNDCSGNNPLRHQGNFIITPINISCQI